MENELDDRSMKEVACDAIDQAHDELRRLNLQIWENPEVMFEEVNASKLLCNWLEGRGWTVKRGVYGISTAFEARFSIVPGGRTVCYNAEYDALPGIGHGCGHNLIATSTLASAVGVSATMSAFNLPGSLIVMGTPAEETGGGKWIMANNGAWADTDVCLMTHPMPDYSTPLALMRASWKFKAQFHGKSTHAAGSPYNGFNACDSIVAAYNGLAMLRQHLQKSESIQSVILSAGDAPNIIPDFAEGSYSIRAKNTKDLHALRKRIEPIFDGAAAMAGCTVEITWNAIYEDVVSNLKLAERYRDYMVDDLGIDMLSLKDAAIKLQVEVSSDFGNCTYIAPGIQTLFNINASGKLHTMNFRDAAGKMFAHDEALRAGKANAWLGIDVLCEDSFFAEVRKEFEISMEEAGRI